MLMRYQVRTSIRVLLQEGQTSSAWVSTLHHRDGVWNPAGIRLLTPPAFRPFM